MSMAKDDYYVLVYQILKYLYEQLKAGKKADLKKVSAENLGITAQRFERGLISQCLT
jgi:hypothetical protein